MERRWFLSLLTSAVAVGVFADDKDEEKKKKKEKDKYQEWVVSTGCAKCNFGAITGATSCGLAGKTEDGKVFLLTGDTEDDARHGGRWWVKGRVSDDGKSIKVKDMKKSS